MSVPDTQAHALVAAQRARPWLDQVPESARNADWKETKILVDLALDGRGKDLVIDILHTCAMMACREPYLLRCDRPETLRQPKDWCGPCRARKALGYPPVR